jgi:hypothetical protein
LSTFNSPNGYTNLEEYQNGTSPLFADHAENTDLDGMWERWELLHGLIVRVDDVRGTWL